MSRGDVSTAQVDDLRIEIVRQLQILFQLYPLIGGTRYAFLFDRECDELAAQARCQSLRRTNKPARKGTRTDADQNTLARRHDVAEPLVAPP